MTEDSRDDERPYAELTPQEQAERRRIAARKAASTRARKRAQRDAERHHHERHPVADESAAAEESALPNADATDIDIAAAEGAPTPHFDADTALPPPVAAESLALEMVGVSKRYGGRAAIEALTFEVRAGQSFGIVGPNGAGKTTTISIATGLLRPDEGSVRVDGIDVWKEPGRAQSQLGVLPDRLRIFDRLTGRQLLVHAALLRRVRRADAVSRAAALLHGFGLADDAERVVADYSIGMQKKIAIAASLVHAPRVVVLDEPFESIDPASTETILAVLNEFRARGGTVILSSHDMRLVERVCDHVAVIDDGALLAVGSMAQVCAGQRLEERFAQIVGPHSGEEELAWLSPSRD